MAWFNKILAYFSGSKSATKPIEAGLGDAIDFTFNDEEAILHLSGIWDSSHIGEIDDRFDQFAKDFSGEKISIDTSRIEHLDTAGAWLIERLFRVLRAKNCPYRFANKNSEHQKLLKALQKVPKQEEAQKKSYNFGLGFVESTGKAIIEIKNDCLLGFHIIGAMLRGSQLKSGKKARSQLTSIVHHLYKMAVTGAPIIILMSFLIGCIITQQSAFYLRIYGAEILTIDLVGVLVFREIGVILTAIMVAGRTGSAMTAEIGSMKMREEVDALTVIGLNPISVLVWPRIVALIIALPLLTILAGFTAIFGSILVCKIYIGINPDIFISHLQNAIGSNTIYSGLIKAPFMAMIIGVVAAIEGLKVGGSAESLGRRVTSAVVKAIFMVILVDGLFAIFYGVINY